MDTNMTDTQLLINRVMEYFERPEHQHPEPWHNKRYAVTYAYIMQKLAGQGCEVRRILEFGGASPFTQLLRDIMPAGTAVDFTGRADVRTSINDFEWPQRYDLILMMEVIEHLHDLPTDDVEARAVWTASGQVAALKLAFSLLKTNGHLLITTPNASDYSVIWRAMNKQPPRTYDPHVREITLIELRNLAFKAGGFILDYGEWEVWHHHGMPTMQIEEIRRLVGERGDDLFLLAKRYDEKGYVEKGHDKVVA